MSVTSLYITVVLLLGTIYNPARAATTTAPTAGTSLNPSPVVLTPEEVILRCSSCGGPETYDPQCGVDGQTYGNPCLLACANVALKNKGVCNNQGCYPYQEGKCTGNFESSAFICNNGLTYIDIAEANCDGTALGPCYIQGICEYHPGLSYYPTTGGKNIDIKTVVKNTVLPGTTNAPYDYSEALTKSLLFYDSMISGKITAAGRKRLTWRGDSCSGCVGKKGEDLSGGFYEAGGSSLKFPGVINGFATFMLAWGGLEFAQGYTATNTMEDLKWKVKWGADHIIAAHVSNSPFAFAGFLGNLTDDFDYYGPIEYYEKYNPPRAVGYVTQQDPASEIVADAAAALAAAALLLNADDPAWAQNALTHAEQLYTFGKTYQGSYNEVKDPSFSQHADTYPSDGFNDELAWAATWLYKATNKPEYLTDAKAFRAKVLSAKEYTPTLEAATLWPAVDVLLAQIDPTYVAKANSFFDKYLNLQVPHTPAGMSMPYHWGNLRHGANVAFLGMIHEKNPNVDAAYRARLVNYAMHQVNYILGDAGRSWLVGFGKDYPTHVWHKYSYNSILNWNEGLAKMIWMTNDIGPWSPEKNTQKNMYAQIAKLDMEGDYSPQKHIAFGTLFGGTLNNDGLVAARKDYTYAEPTIEYNAGITGALAALAQWYNQGPYAGINSLEGVLPFNGANVTIAPTPGPVQQPVLAPTPTVFPPVALTPVVAPPVTTPIDTTTSGGGLTNQALNGGELALAPAPISGSVAVGCGRIGMLVLSAAAVFVGLA